MIDFEFVSPTKIVFGKKTEEKVGELAASFGYKKALIVFGSNRIKNDGLLGHVEGSLKDKGIEFVELSGVRPNPVVSKVIEGVELAKKEKVDFVLAVGGGSVIDTAKSIAVSFFYEGNPFDFNLKKQKPCKSLPIGVILTIASAGSELSNSCVIQDDETGVKQGFNSDLVRPVFAIENPELTFSTPWNQTAAGIADTMMHSLERYFDPSGPYQLSDDFALDLCRNVMEAGKAVQKDPNDYEARAALMLASSLSHNGLTGLGKPFGFVVHPMEHALSGYKPDVIHGAGVALIFPAWAEYVLDRDEEKFARMGERLFNIVSTSTKEKAIMCVAKTREFFASLGLPTSFSDVGLNKSDIPSLVSLVSGNGTRVIGCCHQSLRAEDIEKIFSSLC